MTPQEEGKLLATVENIASMLVETKQDVKGVLNFQAKTEERLRMGNTKFNEHGVSIKKLEDNCAVKCANAPSKAATYTLIVLGFTVIGALITIYKFLG